MLTGGVRGGTADLCSAVFWVVSVPCQYARHVALSYQSDGSSRWSAPTLNRLPESSPPRSTVLTNRVPCSRSNASTDVSCFQAAALRRHGQRPARRLGILDLGENRLADIVARVRGHAGRILDFVASPIE